jgi:transitional endoplasmic reticulum ATPase
MSKLETLREAVALSPSNVPLLLLFAEACLEESSFAEASNAYERVIALEQSNRLARLGLARVAYLKGNISEAVVRAEAILQQHPQTAEARVLLSRLYCAEQNRAAALDQYQKALALNPALRDGPLETELNLERAPAAPISPPQPDIGHWTTNPPPIGEPDNASLEIEFERSAIAFSEVGGMTEVKEEIRMKIIYPMQNRDLFRAYGKRVGGGVLLYGPPGCGKTLISQATAGEIKATFIAVGIHQILDLYIGNSEKNLHQIFQTAREHTPAVLFFDEVDGLAADRKDLRESGMRTLINQFLAEMDGSLASNEGVLILGATNAPWHLDPAFRRPGRFDRVIFVGPPDEKARQAIIEILERDKPIQKLDARTLAKRTKDFSGADLKALFELGAERALARAIKEGRIVPLTTEDLLQTARTLKPSTRAWFESAKNYALYANQGGFYDDVLTFLGIRK